MNLSRTFRTEAERFGAVVDAVPTDGWAASSPCTDWNAGDVVDHVVDTEREFLARVGFAAPDVDGLDRPAAWQAVRDAMQAVLDGPDAERAYDGYFGPTDFSATVAQFYVPDLVVHRWDLARATGQTDAETIDDAEQRLVREAWEPLGDALRGPGVLGPPKPVPAGSDAQTEFLAYAGREA